MTAPERIWAWEYKGSTPWGEQQPDLNVVTNGAEYIRADLAAVQPAQVHMFGPTLDQLRLAYEAAKLADIDVPTAMHINLTMDALEPQPDQTVEIDLRAAMMEELEKAASESPWVPKEYYMNEVISDCCAFLREDRTPQSDPRDEVIKGLVEALDVALAANRGLVRLNEMTEARVERLVGALEEIASYDTGATAGLAYTASAAIAAAKAV